MNQEVYRAILSRHGYAPSQVSNPSLSDVTGNVPSSPAVGPPVPPAPLDPSVVAEVLRLPLAHLDRVLEVRVPGLPMTLWWCPGEVDAEALLADGISRGRVWTAQELLDWLSIGPTRLGTRHLIEVRLEFDALIVDIHPYRYAITPSLPPTTPWEGPEGETGNASNLNSVAADSPSPRSSGLGHARLEPG